MPILDGQQEAAVSAAADRLAAGGLVAFATETVYGLGARADDDAAVAAIFAAKGRPADHPLIVHVATLDDARHFGDLSAPAALQLAQRFWPGPLTLIVPRQPGVGTAAAGGQASIGLRVPSHPVALALLQAAAARGVRGVAAPSANRFGRVSPTTAEHVMQEFETLSADELLVLDGGACQVGIESTIVDATRGQPVLLRPGMITADQLSQACGLPVLAPHELAPTTAAAPKASGTLESHYAPNARVRLMDADTLKQALQLLGTDMKPGTIAVYARQRPPKSQQSRLAWRPMPGDAATCAHELFAVLRELDSLGVALIWVETPPDSPEWQGVRDRLQRAAA